jgi:predicted double-glycine peptidase
MFVLKKLSVLLAFATAQSLPPAKLPALYQPIPLVAQATDYSCGAAASLAVMRYWQVYSGDEKTLYPALETDPKEGTAPDSMVKVLNDYGLDAHFEEKVTIDRLRKELKQGTSVILDLQAWRTDTKTPWKDRWEDGHYVIAVALDDHYLYVMDPSTHGNYAYLPLDELMDRWRDYESRTGTIWRNYQLALFVKGKKADTGFKAPTKLSRME